MFLGRFRFAAVGLIACCVVISASCGNSHFISITPTSAVLIPGQSLQFTGALMSGPVTNPVWLVNGIAGGSSLTGTISPGGLYTAPASAPSRPINISIKGYDSAVAVGFFDPTNFTPGTVTTTQNPLVASYSINVPGSTSVRVQFGPDTTYGLPTSAIQAPASGGNVNILVAGMRASTTYHMQAMLQLANGSQLLDQDQTFTTGPITSEPLPIITTEQFGAGPSPGVELFSLFPLGDAPPAPLSAVATDLQGNVIWYYDVGPESAAYPIKLLPNGHMMLNEYPEFGTGATIPPELREVDLAGNVINRITVDAINKGLAGIATFQLGSFHHDFAVLPNGHVIVLGNYSEIIDNVVGVPPGTQVIGDALVDWDPQKGPVWAWTTFDHLDVARAPYGNGDWTHANAIIYSPDDGNLILSMRNQNWLIKINYQNGAGDGSILWRFGDGGDFTLSGQEAPIEWNYGQHYPSIVSPNSAGVFSLMFFNNGNNRLMDDAGDVCSSPGFPLCYSSVPVFQVDESNRTATVIWEDKLAGYSICCGNATILPSGNREFDVAFDVFTPDFSYVEEVTPSNDLVWKISVENQLAYRGFRIPSLYPGVTWPAATGQASVRVPLRPRSAPRSARKLRTIDQLP